MVSKVTLKTITNKDLEPFRLGKHSTDLYKGRPPQYQPIVQEGSNRILGWKKTVAGIPYVNLSKRARRASQK